MHLLNLLNLATLANLADIIGTLTIVGGAIFAIVQLRELRTQRKQEATIEVLRSFQQPDFAHASLVIMRLPPGISGEELRSHGTEYEEAGAMISHHLETMGYLVHEDMVSYVMVREVTGGLLLVLWDRLRGWIETLREEQNAHSLMEWFQWLADRLENDRVEKDQNPAHIRFADWQPRAS